MKKLNKLQINSERIMKNEELITLRGGYSVNGCSSNWDKWLCSYEDNTIRQSGDFCVPSGNNADGAKDWINQSCQWLHVIYCV